MSEISLNIMFFAGTAFVSALIFTSVYLEKKNYPHAKLLLIPAILICVTVFVVLGIDTIENEEFIYRSGAVATGGEALLIGSAMFFSAFLGLILIYKIIRKKK